ncbi:hypothetical protein [Solemya velum gill symbiont]|uniref:hypothetical protein n=1 Tax=Solemya velum gill symbiont TaxID=2340 RepID=UPI001C4E1BEA|nr:hypothetical protein [Solemya velum gill symbiont]
MTYQSVTIHTAFRRMKNVSLYDMEDYGAQYLHLRCSLICPFYWLHDICHRLPRSSWFYAVG